MTGVQFSVISGPTQCLMLQSMSDPLKRGTDCYCAGGFLDTSLICSFFMLIQLGAYVRHGVLYQLLLIPRYKQNKGAYLILVCYLNLCRMHLSLPKRISKYICCNNKQHFLMYNQLKYQYRVCYIWHDLCCMRIGC